MNILKVTGKFLDQPILVAKFKNAVPPILIGAGMLYCGRETTHAPKSEKKQTAIRTGTTMGITIASALIAPKITTKIFKNADDLPRTLKQIKKDNKGIIGAYLQDNKVSKDTEKILNKAKTSILKFKEVKTLFKDIGTNESGKNFLNELIPNPENINSNEIFSEIGRLSVFGLIPVIGGITGGILGDRLTTKHWRSKIPDKIKEGSYQYLANIFLCNIGAGGALAVLEKFNIKSKSARALGMVSGIITTGILGGSALANIIGRKIIDPILKQKNADRNIYSERRPEPLDIGLHADDIATIAVMSGLKWIEPALPLMYSISGYRAGIGYRNGNHHTDSRPTP